jgi:hypothetical protein
MVRQRMSLLERLLPRRAERRRWRAEEAEWQRTGQHPQRIVRTYRSKRQMRRDRRRLQKLGYEVHFQATSRAYSDAWSWHVTYDHTG